MLHNILPVPQIHIRYVHGEIRKLLPSTLATNLAFTLLVTLSSQIEARQIDFWHLSQVEIRRIELYHFYPPRFIIAVNGRLAVADSHAEISFTGIQSNLQEELPLLIPSQGF